MPQKRKDWTGQTFNRLTFISYVAKKAWLLQCQCGEFTTADPYKVIKGLTKSCGCLRNEILENARISASENAHNPLLVANKFWSHVVKTDGCWEWKGATDGLGYGFFQYNGKRMGAHRFAYEGTYGTTLINDSIICHRCDNPPCIRPEHLFMGTHATNVADCVAKQRNAKGEQSGRAKLNDAIVRTIRAAYTPNITNARSLAKQLAKTYSVDVKTILNVLNGANWTHVQ